MASRIDLEQLFEGYFNANEPLLEQSMDLRSLVKEAFVGGMAALVDAYTQESNYELGDESAMAVARSILVLNKLKIKIETE